MTLLHEVKFKDVKNVEEYLASKKHWVYCSDGSSGWNPANVHQEKIYKRIYKNDDGFLEFHRFADEPDDNSGLRPRIEIVPVHNRVPKLTPVHIKYVVSLVEGGDDFRGMIFQIMDHKNKGGTLPTFQFEMRYGYLHTRWAEVGSDSSHDGTHIHRIARPKWKEDGDNEWHVLDVYMYLSHVEEDGYIRVYRNGKFEWERQARNASKDGGNPQIQYGIYGVKGFDLRTQIKSLMWETVEKIPMTDTIDNQSPSDEAESPPDEAESPPDEIDDNELENGFYLVHKDVLNIPISEKLENGFNITEYENHMFMYQYRDYSNAGDVKFYLDNVKINTEKHYPYNTQSDWKFPEGTHNIKVHVMDSTNTNILEQANKDLILNSAEPSAEEPSAEPVEEKYIMDDIIEWRNEKYHIIIKKIPFI